MKKNILIVTSEFPPQPGGIGNHAYHLALNLTKQACKVTVIADQRAFKSTEEIIFDESLPFAIKRIAIRRFRFRMYLNRVIKTLTEFKQADVIIATGKFSLWSVAFWSLFFKRKTLAVIHGSEVNFKASLLRKSITMSLKRFDTIVAVSNYTKRLVIDLNKEIVVIPNGIDLSQWQTDQISKATLQGHPVLTTVGRVSTRKGQLQVIKLLPALKQRFPDLHYHCIGIPTEAADFKAEAKALGVAEQVTFHGTVSDNALKSMLIATDVFVMLSTESDTGDVEGFGIAILEANAMGIPAIGAKGCGIEDAIQNYKSGILINPKEEQEIVEAFQTIIENINSYQTNASQWARHFAWDKVILDYVKLI